MYINIEDIIYRIRKYKMLDNKLMIFKYENYVLNMIDSHIDELDKDNIKLPIPENKHNTNVYVPVYDGQFEYGISFIHVDKDKRVFIPITIANGLNYDDMTKNGFLVRRAIRITTICDFFSIGSIAYNYLFRLCDLKDNIVCTYKEYLLAHLPLYKYDGIIYFNRVDKEVNLVINNINDNYNVRYSDNFSETEIFLYYALLSYIILQKEGDNNGNIITA